MVANVCCTRVCCSNLFLFLSYVSCLLCVPLSVTPDPKDPIAIERLNLMNMAKLSIKGLIESALNLGRTLDSDYAPLQQFFVVMEHCLKHGLKSTETWATYLCYCLFSSQICLCGLVSPNVT